MAIERIIMAEGSISPDLNSPVVGSSPIPESGIQSAEPNVLVAQESKKGGPIERWLGRRPKAEVLVKPEDGNSRTTKAEKIIPSQTANFDSSKIGEYTVGNKGPYAVFTDPKTGEEVAKRPIIAGGAPRDDEDIVEGEFREITQGLAVINSVDSRNPESYRGPEWLTSPEKGRWLVEQIAYMETELPYEVRWNAENGPVLYRLCDELTAFVERTQKGRNVQDSLDLETEYEVTKQPGKPLYDAIIEAYNEKIARGVEQAEEATQAQPEDFTEIETRGENLETLTAKYKQRNLPVAEREQVEEDLLKYFREARRKGLLKGVDEVFTGIYLAWKNGSIPEDRARALLHSKAVRSTQNQAPEAYVAAEDRIIRRLRDPQVNPRLINIDDIYVEWTRRKLEDLITGNSLPDREGEWRPPGEGDEGGTTESYWRPYGGYPDFYEIYAKNPREFRIAKETFLQMLKNNALGYDPNELMRNLVNFKNKLSAEATKLADEQKKFPAGPDKMTVKFATELRQEFEGRSFLWHSFYNYEHYNKEGGKQGAMAMALHEGPQRWTAALLSGEEGGVGYQTDIFDNSPLVELALNAQGSRGQFGDRTQVQIYLKKTIYEILKERGVGVVLKDYDWRDADTGLSPELRLSREQRLEQLDEHLRRNNFDLKSLTKKDRQFYVRAKTHVDTNRRRIALHQPNEAFKALYEGAENGDAHISNYQEYVVKRGLDPDSLPKRLRDSVKVGKVQSAMDTLRQEIRAGTQALVVGETLIDKLVELERVDDKERSLYQAIYDNSEASFEVAIQMQGVTHETTIRGGGVYFILRNKYVREYLKFRQDRHKNSKATDPDISEWLLADRKSKFTKDQHIGWILDEIKKGKRKETFFPEEQALYNGLNPKDREYFVDHIPTHLAHKAGMAVVNWVRMEYADNAPIWQKPELKALIEAKNGDKYTYPNFRAIYREAVVQDSLKILLDQVITDGFAAKLKYAEYDVKSTDPETGKFTLRRRVDSQSKKVEFKPMKLKEPRIFGYTRNGQAVIAFDENGKPVVGFDKKDKSIGLGEGDYDQSGKAIIFDKPSDIKQIGQVIKKRERVDLENLYNGKKGSLVKRKDGVFVLVDKVALDFQKAANSHLALHTTHTYWAYQSNNTHTLLPGYVIEQALQIRNGELRVEDADILAGLLLTLDPTLSRVKGFPGEEMTLEGIVFDAAVEESYLGFVDARNAFKGRLLPSDGNREHMGVGYYTEDLGGDIRFAVQIEALVAKMPARWARRFAAALAINPMHVDTMANNIGRKGVKGVVSMMADNIHELTEQRIAGQFAITKFINLMDYGTRLWFCLIGGTDPQTGKHHEGVFMKPTNNNDKLIKFLEQYHEVKEGKLELQNDILYGMKDSFGRIEDTLKEIRAMYSDTRNAGGALDLRTTDVTLPDGRFNPTIVLEKQRNTGTSRHIAKMFWDSYVKWLLDEGTGGGVQAYGESAGFYKFLREPYLYWDGHKMQEDHSQTWADWLFNKMAL